MKPLKPVSGATTPRGAKSGSSSLPKICLAILGMIMIVFFLSMGGSNSKSDNLRSGQAQHAGTAATGGGTADVKTVPDSSSGTTTTSGGYGSDSSSSSSSSSTTSAGGSQWYEDASNVEYEEGKSQEDFEEAVSTSYSDIKEAEEDEYKKESGLLSSAISSMGSAITSGIKSLMGSDATDDEVAEIAKEVESELMNSTSAEFQKRADDIAREETDYLKDVVNEEEDEELDYEDRQADLMSAEKESLVNVRTGVDDAGEELRQHLRERAVELEKGIMEKRLSDRLGRPITLQIVDGQVQRPPPPPQQQQQMGGGYQQQPPPPQYGYQQQPAGGYPQQYGYQQPPPQYGYQQPPPQQGGYAPQQGGYQQPQQQQQGAYGYQQQPPPQQPQGYNPAGGYGGAAGAPGGTQYGGAQPAGGADPGSSGFGMTPGGGDNTYEDNYADYGGDDDGTDDDGNDDDGNDDDGADGGGDNDDDDDANY